MRNNRTRTDHPLATAVCVGVCLFGLITSVCSGPAIERTRRMMSNGEESSVVNSKARNETSQNKDYCLMEGHTIPRRLVSCPTKPGCRAIQKEGECCPEYQCECERDGKLYENGEKIMDPETPCRVCYCQGGEFTCNNVTCYNRNDCKPRYTPGRCCPEYDNCPPLEITKADHNENNSSDNTDEDATAEKSTSRTSSESTTTATVVSSNSNNGGSQSSVAVGNDNPLGIKIKEITKPEEIRITDEKPKTVIKVGTTSSTTTTTTAATTTTTTSSPTTEESSSSFPSSSTTEGGFESTSATSETTNSYDVYNKTDDPFELAGDFEQDVVNGTDTNKNVREVSDGGFVINGLDVEEDENENESEIEPEDIFSESDTRSLFFSSTTEREMMGSEQHRDVQQLFIRDHNGDSKPFTVVGSLNLQFGGGSPDEIGEDMDDFDAPASSTVKPFYIDDVDSGDYSKHVTETTATTEAAMDMDGKASTNNEVVVVLPNEERPEGSTQSPGGEEVTPDPYGEEGYNSSSSSSFTPTFSDTFESLFNSSEVNSSEENELTNSTSWDSNEDTQSPSTVDDHEHHHGSTLVTLDTPLENDDSANPGYPKIPDDFSIHPDDHSDDQFVDVHMSTSKPIAVGNYADAEERSPGEPHLIPEWERTNGTESETIDEVDEKLETSEEETNLVHEVDRTGSAEQTTADPLRYDFSGISLQDDMMTNSTDDKSRSSPSPKDDVESLKMRRDHGEGGQEVVQTHPEAVEESRMRGRYLAKETSLWDLFV